MTAFICNQSLTCNRVEVFTAGQYYLPQHGDRLHPGTKILDNTGHFTRVGDRYKCFKPIKLPN